MDVNDLRIAMTLIGLVLFLVLVAHTWSRRRLAEHTDAALLPFMGGDDAPLHQPPTRKDEHKDEHKETDRE